MQTRTRRKPAGARAADLGELSKERLEDMAAAGARVVEVHRLLKKTGDNVVGEILKGQGKFYEWNHYPEGDVYDAESHSQYFYHAHAAGLRVSEHGHFHTFLRPKGMPQGIKPAPLPNLELPEDENDILSHLVGISMNELGDPICLFTANRWVTGEVWYGADDVCAMLDCFVIDHARPSWPTNRWISAMLRLFRPEIVELVHKRDAAVEEWKKKHPGTDVFEDRDLEITSYRLISVQDQIDKVSRALAEQG